MLQTFKLSSGIKRTYEKNSIVHWLRTLPIVGKHIPYGAYGNSAVRILANIFYFMKKVVGFCFAELLYVGAIIGVSYFIGYGLDLDKALVFETVFLFGMLIGLLLNTKLFDPSEDLYYSIVLMRLNARKTLLSSFLYGIIRKVTGYLVMMLPACLLVKVSPLVYLALIVLTVAGKFLGAFVKLQFVKKDKIGTHSGIAVAGIVLIIAGLFACFVTDHLLTPMVVYAVCGVFTVLGLFAFIKLWNYNDYQRVCKVFLIAERTVASKESAKDRNAKNEKKLASAALTTKVEVGDTSNKKGFAYFNDLFFKRHSKILRNRTRTVCVILAVLALAETAFLAYFKIEEGRSVIPVNLSILMMCAPFIMYFINTGEAVTNAMFINCDCAMLSYNFYRTPAAILGVFKQRLVTLIRLNILPAVLVGLIVSIAVYASDEPYFLVDYVSLFVTLIALSIFFSVHRLVIYYLLQPYTEGLVKKSSAYTIVNYATYFVSYMLFNMKDDIFTEPKTFAIITLAFSAVYIGVSLLLVYKFAPKRFKIHKG